MTIAQHQVTRLLQEWGDGDEGALDQLMPLVHDELHLLAHQHMRRERPGHILQTSALINEAYLRLVDEPQIRWENRNHFFGGLSIEEAANVLEVSPGTVMRDWTFARAWLRNEMARA